MYCNKCGNFVDDSKPRCNICGTAVNIPIYKVVILNNITGNLDALRATAELTSMSLMEVKEKLKSDSGVIKEKLMYSEAAILNAELAKKGISSQILPPLSRKENTETTKATPVKIESNEESIKVNEKSEDNSNENKKETRLHIIKFALQAVSFLAVLFIIINLNGFVDKLKNGYETEFSEVAYMSMVQEVCPYQNGRSYAKAFSDEFDYNYWSAFEYNDNVIVQVVSGYLDIDEELTTQFLVTPIIGTEQYEIVPYAMWLTGQQKMGEVEMALVLGAIFEGEAVNAIGELLLYGLLLG